MPDQILLTFTGFHDPFVPTATEGVVEAGPVLTVVAERSFDAVYLFSTPKTAEITAETRVAIREKHHGAKVEILDVPLKDPTNYLGILRQLRKHFRTILRDLLEGASPDADRLRASGDAMDLGGFRQFVHGGDLSRSVRIGVELALDDDGLPDYLGRLPEEGDAWIREALETIAGVRQAALRISVEWSHEARRPFVVEYEVWLNGELFGRIVADPNMEAEVTDIRLKHQVLFPQSNPSLPARMVGTAFPGELAPGEKEELTERPDMIGAAGECLDYCFDYMPNSWTPKGGEKSQQPRQFGFIRSPSPDRWADGSAAWDLLHGCNNDENSSLGQRVSLCLSDAERLNLGYRLESSRAYAVATDGIAMARLAKLAASPDAADIDRETRAILEGVTSSPEIVTLSRTDNPPLIEIHRCCTEGSGREKRPVPNDEWEKHFRGKWSSHPAAKQIEVFIWSKDHDRHLISDLIGIHLGNGFDLSNDVQGRVSWSRMSRDDRDDMQRTVDPAVHPQWLLHRFPIPTFC